MKNNKVNSESMIIDWIFFNKFHGHIEERRSESSFNQTTGFEIPNVFIKENYKMTEEENGIKLNVLSSIVVNTVTLTLLTLLTDRKWLETGNLFGCHSPSRGFISTGIN